jgi:pimeloyl-ACP methyl ester carboxylesterase
MKPAELADAGAIRRPGQLAPPWPGEVLYTDGRPTYVRYTPATAASAEPALYVHGLGGSSQNWTDLADLLSDRLDGIALDLPGFGRSGPAARYTLEALAARVERVIEVTGRGPVHLVGNSLGGAISVKVAAARPDLVRSLTLISPAMPFLNAARSEQGRVVPLLLVPNVTRIASRRLATIDPAELTRQVIQACFADPSGVPEQRLNEAIAEATRRRTTPWYADAYVRTLRGLVSSFLRAYLPGSGSLWRTAARITAPTLVIGGGRDRLVDVRVPPRVAQVIPDARLLELPELGHVAQMEDPPLTARAIIALLDEVAGMPGAGNLVDEVTFSDRHPAAGMAG